MLDEIKFYPYPVKMQQRLDHLREKNAKVTERYLLDQKRTYFDSLGPSRFSFPPRIEMGEFVDRRKSREKTGREVERFAAKSQRRFDAFAIERTESRNYSLG